MQSMDPVGVSPVVQVDNLTKRYGNLVAVDRVAFSVDRGEVFGFLGPNGAGKTTTVRILTGVLPPDAGTAVIAGYPAGSIRAKQLIAVVPELANPYPDLSGWRNLLFMAEVYGVPAERAKRKSDVLLEELGLFPRKHDLVRTYSKGMRQRLILCMALVSEPEILFLDEPTGGLDVQSTRLIRDMLRRLNGAGMTIFLTTHDMEEANQLCHRVAIINTGRIVAIDAPERIRLATSGMHSVEASFKNRIAVSELASLSGVNNVTTSGDKYRLYTSDPGEVVVSLVNYCSAAGVKIVSLNVLTPSLEDAFVALTTSRE